MNGSFVTSKRYPNDFDAGRETEGVDFSRVGPILLDRDGLLNHGRRRQKAELGRGEFIPDRFFWSGVLEFFRRDARGNSKGIIAIDLREDDYETIRD